MSEKSEKNSKTLIAKKDFKNKIESNDEIEKSKSEGESYNKIKKVFEGCRTVIISECTIFALLDQFLMAEIKVLQGGKRESKHCHIGIDQLFEKIKRKEKEKEKEKEKDKDKEKGEEVEKEMIEKGIEFTSTLFNSESIENQDKGKSESKREGESDCENCI